MLSRSKVLLMVWCGAERDGELAQPLPEVVVALSVMEICRFVQSRLSSCQQKALFEMFCFL